MHVHSYLQLQFSYKDIRIFLSSAILKSQLQKILIQWSMGHSGDDVNHKKPSRNENALTKSAENFGIGLFYNFL